MIDHAHRGLWSAYDDGLVSGRLLHRLLTCDVCGRPTACVEVEDYDPRLRAIWHSTIIALYRQVEDRVVAVYLGLGCGCLAKLHRQVVHIEET